MHWFDGKGRIPLALELTEKGWPYARRNTLMASEDLHLGQTDPVAEENLYLGAHASCDQAGGFSATYCASRTRAFLMGGFRAGYSASVHFLG